jgi:hypothetical protein
LFPLELQAFAQRLNPLHDEIFRNYSSTYYWTAFQWEWATDVMFRPGTLAVYRRCSCNMRCSAK